jgi:glycosyltransferase involved in cell wall biosynthesis
MNVLFYPRRRAPEQRGGDWLALQETIRALEPLGVRATISTDPTLDLAPFDIVHLYSLGDPYSALEYALNVLRQQKPFVVTPIYWRHHQWLDARLRPTPNHPEYALDALSDAERAQVHQLIQLEENLYTGVHQFILRAAARVFILSHAEGEILRADFGVRAEQMRVTHNGVAAAYAHGDAERFLAAHSIPARDFVLCVARVEERKNSLGVIRAWREENVPLVFVGRAPDEAYLQMCRAEAGAHVYFCGALSPDQVADACAAAKVHVMASWWEEQGMAALEAGIAGCNLVMTQNSPGREYFGDACFTCDPADARSIHDAIRAALDAPRNSALAAHIRETFTWERAANTLRDAYAAAQNTAPASIDPFALINLTAQLRELWHIKHREHLRLSDAAAQQAAWLEQLEAIQAQRRRRRVKLDALPFVQNITAWLERRG